MNKKWLYAQHARRYAAEGLAAGASTPLPAGLRPIRLLTDRYNRETAGGKWRNMMSCRPAVCRFSRLCVRRDACRRTSRAGWTALRSVLPPIRWFGPLRAFGRQCGR